MRLQEMKRGSMVEGEVFAVTPDDAMFQKGTIKVESVVSGDKITVSSSQ